MPKSKDSSLNFIIFFAFYLQKKRKYGAVVNITITAMVSSISSSHVILNQGIVNINIQEKRNITRDGEVFYNKYLN